MEKTRQQGDDDSPRPQKQAPQRSFFIIGHNISHSLSPTIHNAAFRELDLPYHYSIYQTPQVDDTVARLLGRLDFGGASVTYPHKLQIQKFVHSLSDSARKLGAVNTIIVEDGENGRKLRGDNTDWLGIRSCIIKHGAQDCKRNAMLIGAGGAARAVVFALQKLGHQEITIVNRTASTAERLANDFPHIRFDICKSLFDAGSAGIIIACIPADDIKESDIPEHIFDEGGGLVVEMAYRPVVTSLMKVASRHDSWTVVGGIDVLKEQAYAQFRLWTGRRAPVEAIEAALGQKSARLS